MRTVDRVYATVRDFERFFPTHYWSAWQIYQQNRDLTYKKVESAADALVLQRRFECIIVENKRAYKLAPKGGHRRK